MKKGLTVVLALVVLLAVLTACTGTSTYSVTVKNGYGLYEVVEVKAGDTYTLPEITRDGYSFLGWKQDGATELLQAGDKVTVNGAITFVAQWEKIINRFEVTFKDGDDILSRKTVDGGSTLVLPECSAVKENDTFAGWLYDGKIYAEGESVEIDADATFVAQWKPISVTIEFKDGKNILDSETADKGTQILFPECSAQYAGKDFAGWLYDGKVYEAGESVTVTAATEAVAQWTDIEYTVTFTDGDVTIKTETLYYGDMPTPPAMEDKIVDERTVARFTGWSSEISAVTENVEYSAVYVNEARLYTLTFDGGEFVEFLSSSDEVVTSVTREYDETYTVKIRKFAGVNVNAIKVLLNGEEVAAADGVYEIPFAADAAVTVDGAYFVEYDIGFSSSNVQFRTEMPEANTYGSILKLYAVGNEWYSDSAPVVTYAGENILPVGTESVEGKDYHVYEITLKQNGTVSVAGIEDVVPVTFVYLNESVTVDWKISYGPIGISSDILDLSSWSSYLLEGTDQLYRVVGEYDSNWNTFFSITADKLDSYIMSEDEARAYAKDRINNYLYPVKGEDNTYYAVYYFYGTDTSGKLQTYIGFTAPVGAYDFAYFIEGESSDWVSYVFSYSQSPANKGNYYEPFVYNSINDSYGRIKFYEGDVVYIKFSMPDDKAMPVLTNTATDEQLVAGTYTVNGAEVTGCYKFVAAEHSDDYECGVGNTYTWSYVPVKFNDDEYNVYNMYGNPPNGSVTVEEGATWEFRFFVNLKKTDILARLTKQSDGTYVGKDGVEPFTFLGDYIPEYSYHIPAIGEYDSFVSIYITITDIRGDVLVDLNVERKSADFAFKIDENYTVYIDGVPVEGEAGEIVIAKVTYDSELKFVSNSSSFFIEEDAKITYYYLKNGVSTAYKSADLKVVDGYCVFVNGAYTFNTPVDTSKPFEIHGVALASAAAVNNTDKCASSDGNNGITFPDGKPYYVTPEGTIAFTVRLPFGNHPVLYIEYADLMSDGYYTYDFTGSSEDGDYTVFTFEVTGITSALTWFIKLEPNVYEVTVHYGEETEVVELKHGEILADSEVLRKSYVGTLDGKYGEFTVTGWSTTEGGNANILLVSGPQEIWAVTEFNEYRVAFGDEMYLSLADALKALPSDASGNLDILWTAEPEVLKAGDYVIPAGVTLRLPYADGQYDRKLAVLEDSPSMYYASAEDGTVILILNEGATLRVRGAVSVGGIVGYPETNKPYQGQTSAAHAVLRADGEMIVEQGGLIDVNGYIVGGGTVTLQSGAVSRLPFIVKDYRGGTNSSNVYYEGVTPFNIYEMPNIQTEYIIHYGASEKAYAMLFAMGGFNVATVEAIGESGIIRLNEGGYVVKKTTEIDNPRYLEETASYEPKKEFRTTIDVYGGGTDGAMSLDLGITSISTEGMFLAIPYTYGSVTLHDGDYTIYNKYKIMPGAELNVASDATLTLAATTLDGKAYMGTITVYEETFAENIEGIGNLANNKQLCYPVKPNNEIEGGKFVLSGTLNLRGSFGGEIIGGATGAKINVYTANANLTVYTREAVHFSGQEFKVTYEQTSKAVVNTASGLTELSLGELRIFGSDDLWS